MADADSKQLPFEVFTFTLVDDKRPRTALSLKAADQGMYELHVEKGSASNPTSQFTRLVPTEVAQRLKDALQDAGVFGWEESYGDSRAPGSRRWSVATVFKKDVFSVASRGGSDVPPGFERLLEELYRLDFPRPNGSQGQESHPAQIMPSGLDGIGADYSQLSSLMKGSGLEGLDATEMLDLMEQARSNPQALQSRMREKFQHLPREEQERLLDALASAGGMSRAWWERFLRGQ